MDFHLFLVKQNLVSFSGHQIKFFFRNFFGQISPEKAKNYEKKEFYLKDDSSNIYAVQFRPMYKLKFP